MPVELPLWLVASASFALGVVLVIESVEIFVESVTEAAIGLGVSGFFLTVVLAGTDLENAVLGLAAVTGRLPGVAIGTVFGEALFILGAAVGLAGLLTPFETDIPRPYLLLLLGSPALFFVLALDGTLTRLDGLLLTLSFPPLLGTVFVLERNTRTRYLSAEELGAVLEDADEDDEDVSTEGILEARFETVIDDHGRLHLVLSLLAVIGMTVGSELAVVGARDLLGLFGIGGLAFGATVMSFIASLEELALTVHPVRRGRAHIGVGNVVGSMLFFVTANAGVIALVRPIDTGGALFAVHWPFFIGTLLLVGGMFFRNYVGRLEGGVLIGFYLAYWIANYVGWFALPI